MTLVRDSDYTFHLVPQLVKRAQEIKYQGPLFFWHYSFQSFGNYKLCSKKMGSVCTSSLFGFTKFSIFCILSTKLGTIGC